MARALRPRRSIWPRRAPRGGEDGVSNRRRNSRYALAKTSALFFTDQRAVYARIYDASEQGLGLRVPVPFQVGEVVTVTIPSGIRMRARVVWTDQSRHAGMGLEVVEILEGADEYRRLLDESERIPTPTGI